MRAPRLKRTRKVFRVEPVPNMSDTPDCTYFRVYGPDVQRFVTMERLAEVMAAALNSQEAQTDVRKTV